ncbi:MAG: ABC transporter substrate-binding protein [Desulfobacterales bacterium]|jgi:4-phytase/acid phosphatase/peptide/nickel transport system substrate-binding protein
MDMLDANPNRPGNRKQHGILILLMTVLICVHLGGCGEKKTEALDTRHGGVLYVGIEVPFHGFDILTQGTLNPPQAPLNNLILEPLFRKDKSGNMVPILGLSATPSDDKKTWDIKLRRGVLFHDGVPFNADAVIHHWTRILSPDFRGRRLLKPIQRVEKIDDYTVRFHLAHPWPAFKNLISNELALLAFIPSPRAVDVETHHRKPVGTGPFKYNEWRGGDHFIVLKNHHYWQKGKPLLDKVVFRTIPDHQARYASLVSGQLDVIILDRGNLIQKAKADPSLHTYKVEGNGAEIILMNTRQPPLDDIRVRRALALANNQKLHVKMIYGNQVPVIHHPCGSQFTCKDDGYLDYDPEKARELMAAYGQPVELELLHSNTSRGRQIGELMQQLYKKIGVNLKPVSLSPPPHVSKVIAGNYQLATWRIPPSGDQGPRLYNHFYSRSPMNVTGYSTPEMDRLLEMQRIETDEIKRKDLLCDIFRQLNQDVPFLYRSGRGYHIIAGKKIKDMLETPGFKIDLASAWIDEADRFNVAALQIEIDSAPVAVECPESEDAEAVKASLQGSWEGKTSFGARIRVTFDNTDKIKGYNASAGREFTRKYVVCGNEAIWFAGNGAQINGSVADNGQNLKIKYTMQGTSVVDTFARIP